MPSPKMPSSTTQTTKFELSPEQKKLFELGFPKVEEYASTPLQQFEGTGIVDFSDLEKTAQGSYLQQAGGAEQLSQQANQGYEHAQGLNQGVLGNVGFQLDVANNPYLKDAVMAMTGGINDNLLKTQLPAIRSGATQASGAYSGASSKAGIAEGQAVAGTNQNISDTVAKMMFEQYNRGMGNLNQSVGNSAALAGIAPTLQQAGLVAPDIISAVGGQQRQMEQARLDEQINKFYTEQALPLVQGQDLLALIQGLPGGTATSTTSAMRPQSNPFGMMLGGLSLANGLFGAGGMFGGAAGGATAGAGAAGGMGGLGGLLALLSDRRFKRDIKRVGKLENGLNVYTFKYLDSGTTHMGVMAQELEEVQPDAVTEDMFGVKYVDYAKIQEA